MRCSVVAIIAFHVYSTSLGDTLATVDGLDRAVAGFLVEPWASRKLPYLLSKLRKSFKQFRKTFLEKHSLLKTMADNDHKIVLMEDRARLDLFQYDFLEQARLRHDQGSKAVRKMRRRLVTQHDSRFQVTDTKSGAIGSRRWTVSHRRFAIASLLGGKNSNDTWGVDVLMRRTPARLRAFQRSRYGQ